MPSKVKWALCLATVLAAAYLAVRPAPPREPFAGEGWGEGWEVESVMLVRTDGSTTYSLEQPYRVVRGGRVVLNRPERNPTLPIMRVNLIIDGEHVTVFARLRE
jgi:hypothetical protein